MFSEIASFLYKTNGPAEIEVHAFWVPGRVELLGKHVDYAGGKSVVAALQRGFAFVVYKHKMPNITVVDVSSKQSIGLDLVSGAINVKLPWGKYVQAVVERIRDNFLASREGGTICFCSNLPSSAGLSSSSALLTGLFLSLNALYNVDEQRSYKEAVRDQMDLADYLGHVENGHTYKSLKGNKGVGTLGGSQDHTAILCSRKNYLRVFAYKPNRFLDEMRLPSELTLCVASSGVKAEKTRNARIKYNACSMQVRQIIDCIQKGADKSVSLEQVLASSDYSLEIMRERLEECGDVQLLLDRLYHYYYETQEIIPTAIQSFKENDFKGFGAAVRRSQVVAETYLKNQVKETSSLARCAYDEGALASSAFGAGFGGSVWALVHESTSASFLAAWKKSYLEAFPEHEQAACFFLDNTGPPASKLSA